MKKSLILFAIIILITLFSSCKNSAEKEAAQGTGYNNAKISWGFKKIKGMAPQIPQSWEQLLKRYGGYYI